MLYSNGCTSSEIAAAVAAAILEDVVTNNVALSGLPRIEVRRAGSNFDVGLSFYTHAERVTLSDAEAKYAVDILKRDRSYSPAIFRRIQDAVASLEAQSNRGS